MPPLPASVLVDCPPSPVWQHRIQHAEGWDALGVWLDAHGIKIGDEELPEEVEERAFPHGFHPILYTNSIVVEGYINDPQVEAALQWHTPYVHIGPVPFGEPASCVCEYPE